MKRATMQTAMTAYASRMVETLCESVRFSQRAKHPDSQQIPNRMAAPTKVNRACVARRPQRGPRRGELANSCAVRGVTVVKVPMVISLSRMIGYSKPAAARRH
jgi:hypothetical protein